MIVFKHVDKVYPNGFQALKDINLTINDGDFVSIIGLSGAGKSTLLRTINKMHDIQKGDLTVDVYKTIKNNKKDLKKELKVLEASFKNATTDEEKVAFSKDIEKVKDKLNNPEKLDNSEEKVKRTYSLLNVKGKNLRFLRRNIGMIFQSFNLVKRSNVYKNVLSGRVGYHNAFETMFGLYSKEEKMLALRSIDKLGILNKAYVRSDQLSGGQMQRVALARALTQESSIILADEPVASLDPATTRQVMDDFKRINKEEKITIVANMHHVDLAKEYSNRIIGIKNGEIVFDGKPEEVTDEVIYKIYGRKLKHSEKIGEANDETN